MSDVEIETPDIAAADTIADQWVHLAREQHSYGSGLSAGANRGAIRETVVQSIVTGGTLIARATGDIVGFVTFGPDTGQFQREDSRGTIRNLYVEPEYRNAGIGSALIEAAEDALAEAGVETIRIDAMADNEAAKRLYRRHGYTPHRVELTKPIENDTH